MNHNTLSQSICIQKGWNEENMYIAAQGMQVRCTFDCQNAQKSVNTETECSYIAHMYYTLWCAGQVPPVKQWQISGAWCGSTGCVQLSCWLNASKEARWVKLSRPRKNSSVHMNFCRPSLISTGLHISCQQLIMTVESMLHLKTLLLLLSTSAEKWLWRVWVPLSLIVLLRISVFSLKDV